MLALPLVATSEQEMGDSVAKTFAMKQLETAKLRRMVRKQCRKFESASLCVDHTPYRSVHLSATWPYKPEIAAQILDHKLDVYLWRITYAQQGSMAGQLMQSSSEATPK